MQLLEVQEPFSALFTQGMITREGAKMSSSRGNAVAPSSIVERFGADTARCNVLFIGPPDQDADWSDEGVEGVHRFLGRLWRLSAEVAERAGPPGEGPPAAGDAQGSDLALLRKTHWAIEKVTGDLRRFAFNTAIAAVMELLNECRHLRDSAGTELLFPFAPHVSADAYELLTGMRVWEQPWPQAEEALLESDSYELVCQVNGKLRDRVLVATGTSAEELKHRCRVAPNVRAHVDGREIVKEIVVPGKLVNLVVR